MKPTKFSDEQILWSSKVGGSSAILLRSPMREQGLLQKAFTYAVDDVRFRVVQRRFRRFTMIPRETYLGNLHVATRIRSVPGSIVECGTWRGGMIAGIAVVLGPERQYYLFDSYEGLPPAGINDPESASLWTGRLRAEEADAREAMRQSGAHQVTICKGWFADTVPNTDPGPIALLRLDGDWYDSTKCVLDSYGDRLVVGGVILIDDYNSWGGCTQAVNEFAAKQRWPIHQWVHGGVHFLLRPSGPIAPPA